MLAVSSWASPCFLFFTFFWMWTIFKVFIEFVTILLLFCFASEFVTILLLFPLWPPGIWDLSFLTRDQTLTLALEGESFITGPPGKSPHFLFLNFGFLCQMG